ncbi:uncharacterized protein LOC131436663 [Malaya genurostris]|uniref:uncharacterized protein LOC131436663 n=1 Tax=Malaya genurostris TaxID=325434 RepID=UPI0026F3AAE4|nr:uncharacterized protein LOC131436663 [Malaya genurostris]
MAVGNIERVLIELRPRLQSANFFIGFSRRFAEIKSTKIDLGSDRIIITTENNDECYEIRLGDYFKLHTQTLSSLMIKNSYICFRINTNENIFHSEVLEINDYNVCSDLKLECGLQTDTDYILLCSNCCSPLRDESIKFKRILELPSDHMDSNDWYCHQHLHECAGVSQTNGESSSNTFHSNKLAPSETDLFFGPFYAILDRKHLLRVHLKAERFLYCKRCLQYLGTMKRNGSAKLWYENLRFQVPNNNSEETTPTRLCLFQKDQLLANFEYLVRKTVNDFNFISHLGLPPIFKIIFEMRRPGLDGEIFYLLVQIMDVNLNVFKIRKTLDIDSSSGDEQPDNEGENQQQTYHDYDNDEVFVVAKKTHRNIHLDRHKTMKLMYRYEKFDQQPIVNFWLQDTNAVNVEISEKMFRAAIRYLDGNSNFVPECYRNNLGFILSYLDIT